MRLGCGSGGNVERHRLRTSTKTDAIAELRALQVDHARGDQHRSRALAVTVAELLDGFTAHMRSRIGNPDAKRRRSARTVDHYDYVLKRYALPTIGTIAAPDLTAKHLRRLDSERASAHDRVRW